MKDHSLRIFSEVEKAVNLVVTCKSDSEVGSLECQSRQSIKWRHWKFSAKNWEKLTAALIFIVVFNEVIVTH